MSMATDTSAAEERLQASRAQLSLYARDFKSVLEAEHQKAEALEVANRQLQIYAKDLRAALEVQRCKAHDLENAYLDSVHRLILASQYKDEETGAHVVRMSHYVKALALHLRWESSAVDLLFAAAPMHDVGKIAVPDAVLLKPAPLDEYEWEVMKRHTTYGASLLQESSSDLLELGREVALNHHERWDGSGYPSGLRGEEIPLSARLLIVADQYDALRSERPYKSALSHAQVCDVLLHGDGRTLPQHFDPDVLRAFGDLVPEFEAIHAQYAS